MIPSLVVQVQGQAAVSADNLNTFIQVCDTAANLANFTGLPNMTVQLLGLVTPGDGGQGFFYWANGVFTNDGINVIVPYGVMTGAWLRLPIQTVAPLVTVTGTTIANDQYFVPINNQTGLAFSIDLPLTPVIGEVHVIKDWAGNAGAHSIAIYGPPYNIDANSSVVMNSNFQVLRVFFSNGRWSIW